MTFNGPITFFSFLLGEDKFRNEPTIKKAKTTQIPISAVLYRKSNAIPDLLITIMVKISNMSICRTAAILNLTGSFPGYFPPSVNSPNGAPNAKTIWNIATAIDNPMKIYANISYPPPNI